MTAYIISFNRITSLQKLCSDLVLRGCVPVIIDNSSTYPPLVDWLLDCPYKVIGVPNTGSRSPWKHNIVEGGYYIVTDSDLDISSVPLDMLDVLMRGLEENPTAMKCGLSLRLDDLPDNIYANKAKEHEKVFWVTMAGDYYSAPVDTTLALYSAERMKKVNARNFYNAVRTPPPYSARHLPWYVTPDNITEEEKYYADHLVIQEGHWVHEYKRTYYDNANKKV